MQRTLEARLNEVAWRYRRRQMWITLSAIWAFSGAAGAALLVSYWNAPWLPLWPTAVLLIVALMGALAASAYVTRRPVNQRRLAQRIERAYPELDARLLAAVEQQHGELAARRSYLRESVIGEAVQHAVLRSWQRVFPQWQLQLAKLVHAVALLALATVVIALLVASGPQQRRAAFLGLPPAVGDEDFRIVVEPGDTELERGSSLLVVARFSGSLPETVELSHIDSSGARTQQRMSRSLDDPLFGGRIGLVEADLTYRVHYGSRATRPFQVTVFEYPELKRADARLVFPGYTGMEETLVQDTRQITAVEGTELTLLCYLNKPVVDAQLRDETGRTLRLTADEEDPLLYQVQLTATESRRFRLHLRDDRDRRNREIPELALQVTRNQPPDLKIAFPGRDTRVSPLEELRLQATAWDDFGIERVGLSYSLGGDQPAEIPLAEKVAAKQSQEIQHLVALEDLDVRPDQLVAYHLWAEDKGPDGSVRRTQSDMFFAEVRHFEEIFRQGQQPPGGQSQQQQQQAGGTMQAAEELAELQKQIISGTWNLQRRQTLEPDADALANDTGVLHESQEAALAQADELEQDLQDPESLGALETARQHMRNALESLESVTADSADEQLEEARSSEQAAYQALLKLRAREFEVTRGQQQQGSQSSSSAASRSQQQLDQLELDDQQNRYETESTATAPEEEQADRETRQVLNRLRELAQRQQDLNEQLKELQTALEEAQTAEEQEELQRQLKRLRDQQEQILRDVDELRNRMERPENQQRMSEAREQLEQTRSNVQQSSEALEEGQVSQALSSGTRAQRELKQMQEQFRQQTANQFAEEMRDMQQSAQQLDERQQELAEQLQRLGTAQPQDLRSSPRQQVSEQLDQQQQQLSELMDRMRDVVQAAEEAEPLLSNELYDALRRANQQQPQRSLEATREMVERGLAEQAQREEAVARASIGQLREAVDEAAEKVVGDQTEALRRARDELDQLTEQLAEEIARHSPAGSPTREQQADAGQSPGSPQPDASNPSPSSAPGPEQSEQSQVAQASAQQSTDGQVSRAGGQSDQQQATPSDRGQQRSGSSNRPRDGQRTSDTASGGGAALEEWLAEQEQWTGPITGEEYREWTDRLRDVEELIDDPGLRAEAARIRDRVRGVRAEIQRHSKEPNWPLIQESVVEPLTVLREQIAQELKRRQSRDALVPIDRDPVPPEYDELVRRYYEQLGSGQ